MSKLRDSKIQIGAVNIYDDFEMANALDSMIKKPNAAQEELIKLCQNENIWKILCSLPHPTGMKNMFNNRPFNLGDYAWSCTQYSHTAVKTIPIVLKAINNENV